MLNTIKEELNVKNIIQNQNLDEFVNYSLDVICPDELMEKVHPQKRQALIRILENDPRPSYQHDKDRIYKMCFGDLTISFTVSENILNVVNIIKI